mgnify:FL=1
MSQDDLDIENEKSNASRSIPMKKFMLLLCIFVTIGALWEIINIIHAAKYFTEIIREGKTLPHVIAELYFKSVVAEDKVTAKKLFCNPRKYSNYPQGKIKSFRVIQVNPKKVENSEYQYHEAEVEQEIIAADNQLKLVKKYIHVWETDEHYRYMTQKYSDTSANNSIQTERKNWSSSHFCIAPDENIAVNNDSLSTQNQ